MYLINFFVFLGLCPSWQVLQANTIGEASIISKQSDTIVKMQGKLQYLNEKMDNIISGKILVQSKYRGDPGLPGLQGQRGYRGKDIRHDDPLVLHFQQQLDILKERSDKLNISMARLSGKLPAIKVLPVNLASRLYSVSNNLEQHVHFVQDLVANKGNLLKLGDKGTKGPAGWDGIPGIKGVKGYRGLVGPKGKTMEGPSQRGLPGEKGSKGISGIPGLPGLPGIPGMKGEKGYPGPSGSKGNPASL